MTTDVTIPLINPNEPEAILAGLHVQNGQKVVKGARLATLETTKSTAELLAEAEGYVSGLAIQEGETVKAGDFLCVIRSSPDAAGNPAGIVIRQAEKPALEEQPAELRITAPAQALARQLGLDLAMLPVGPLITEQMVRAMAGEKQVDLPLAFAPTAILVYGGGGHGKSLIELLRLSGAYQVVGIIDDGIPAGKEIAGVRVLGGSEVLPTLATRGLRLAVNGVGGIGSIAVRMKVFQRLAEAGYTCPPVVHPVSFIEASAHLAQGVQVLPHAYVGSDAQVGFGSIINTGAIVSHDCQLGEYVNLSPGAILAGEVEVSDRTLIGMGVTVNLRVKIGAGARIGNGATVKADVPANGLVHAGATWPELIKK